MGEFFKCICKDLEGDIRFFIKKYGDVLSFAAKAIPVVGQTLSAGIKTIGMDIDANSSLGLLLSNYKYDLID